MIYIFDTSVGINIYHTFTHTECPGGATNDPSVFEGCTIIQGSLRVTNPVE